MPAAKSEKNKKEQKKQQKSFALPLIISISSVVIIVSLVLGGYFWGKNNYQDRFLPNTYINDENVSGKTLSEAINSFETDKKLSDLVIVKRDNSKVVITADKFDYKYNVKDQITELYNKIDHSKWLKNYFDKSKYEVSTTPTYDKTKLEAALKAADWGKTKNQNAEIVKTDKGYEIKDAVQGDEMDYAKLRSYVLKEVESGNFNLKAQDSNCYIAPKIQKKDLEDTLKKIQNAYKMKITYNFDYTTETLTGDKLMNIISVDKDGKIKADPDKAMKYVEELAKKYDTYNTKRKFKATIQGDIVVPTSADAKYGWWIDQQKTCDELVEMLEAGKSVDKVDPIYYQSGNYVFTGRKEARTKNDDIGNTYVEVDLTNQTLWYYKNGKKEWECGIVSGQTTSEARTTLPGVYKVWDKQTNYRMKDTNADGDSWDTTCSYWTRVAIVGIGLHDSQWRGNAVGGDIYKYNGSHGCINMTLESAKYIYDNVDYDTPVVMYY